MPIVSYGPQGPRERARTYAFAFGNASDELRRVAFDVAKYLRLPRPVIVSTWDSIDSMTRSGKRAAA